MSSRAIAERLIEYPSADYEPIFLRPFITESSAQEIAKRIPLRAAALLERASQRRLYADCTEVAGEIVNKYLSVSSQENVDRTEGVDIDMQHHKGLLGNDRGFSLRIRFKKGR